jgi:predicted nucleic acid-binding protein
MASQQPRGLSLDENDLWIAATALVLHATLVSRDDDFQATAGLSLFEP